jgi:DNA repair protein RecO (recombination protein O)
MNWQDNGIVLAARKFGDTAAIATLLTRSHGRQSGLVHGGIGRRMRPILQPGNEVAAEWRARLAEQLGSLRIEATTAWSAQVLDDPARLAALGAACALANATMPIGEAHEPVYRGLQSLLRALGGNAPDWPFVYVRWELGLLAELGFGLDLEKCAVTGAGAGLTHVSPKSGRAVSAAAAEPYREKLLVLPAFLAPGQSGPPANDVAHDTRAGLALTGYFLEHRVFEPHDAKLPAARARLVQRLTGAASDTDVIRAS